MPFKNSILRERKKNEHGKVTFVELFFDLVFVFAVTQISHGLLTHFTLLGGLHALLLLMAVWWVWIYTSWVTNWLDPNKIPVRLMLFVLMLVGLILSTSLPEAFYEKAPYFAVAYVIMQVGRSLFTMAAVRLHDEGNYKNFQRITVWLLVSAVFWIAGGFSEEPSRTPLWIIALIIEYVGPSAGYAVPWLGRSRTTDWHVEGGHLAERCGLFIIIALGESILMIGANFGDQPWNPGTIGALLVSFVSSVTMWWLYFNLGAERGSQRIQHSHDPARHARRAYTYIHLPIVAGIIVAAVSDEMVLAHPLGDTTPETALAIAGGAALYLTGNFLFKWSTASQLPNSHLVGLGLLAICAPSFLILPPVAFSGVVAAIMILVAAWEASAVRITRDRDMSRVLIEEE